MEVLQNDDGKKGKFYILFEDKEVAAMTYVWAGTDRIIIDHTEVDEAMAGQKLGKQMVLKAVSFARQNQIAILPLCPFAKSVFDKNVDLKDVL